MTLARLCPLTWPGHYGRRLRRRCLLAILAAVALIAATALAHAP